MPEKKVSYNALKGKARSGAVKGSAKPGAPKASPQASTKATAKPGAKPSVKPDAKSAQKPDAKNDGRPSLKPAKPSIKLNSQKKAKESVEIEEPFVPVADFHAGYCAIVGIPNAGKSTLMNALLGTKLSIMSQKPQTTRKRVLGIYSDNKRQVIFLDTPGIMPRPTTLLHHAMLEQVTRSFEDADVILVLAEATKPVDKALPAQWEEYVRRATGKKLILAVSKIDLVKDKTALFPVLQAYGEMNVFDEIIPISSTKRHNLKDVVNTLHKYLPEADPFFDKDQLSDQNERFFVSELIREAIFKKYGEEVPYSTEVEIREFNERQSGKWYINADIVVERDSQKAIIIGAQGSALKDVGARARREIEEFLDHPVFLELHVKAKSDWRNDKMTLKNFGYNV